MLQQAARRPFSARPLAILASLVPDGTVDTGFIASGLSTFVDNAWPADPMWICAVRQRDGRRVVFGRDTSPAVPLAVAASSAIPRVFRPVVIDDDSYIDGGAHSPTNADLLATSGLDLVLVSSPMSIASRQLRLSTDQPFRQWSRLLLDSEMVRIRHRGTTVMAFQPNRDDLSVVGLSAMDPDRRGPIALQAYASTCHRLSRADVRQRLAPLGGR